MGLLILVLGLVILLGAHVFVTFRAARAKLIARFRNAYRILFVLVSLVGLALIIWGFAKYRAEGWVQTGSLPLAQTGARVWIREIRVPTIAAGADDDIEDIAPEWGRQ